MFWDDKHRWKTWVKITICHSANTKSDKYKWILDGSSLGSHHPFCGKLLVSGWMITPFGHDLQYSVKCNSQMESVYYTDEIFMVIRSYRLCRYPKHMRYISPSSEHCHKTGAYSLVMTCNATTGCLCMLLGSEHIPIAGILDHPVKNILRVYRYL